jgi:protein phosphatase
MEIRINPPLLFQGSGKRQLNHDCIFPALLPGPNAEDRLFMVCDGSGPSAFAGVAARLVCRAVIDFITMHPVYGRIQQEYAASMLRYIETRFDRHISENPGSEGMASTLAILQLSMEGAVILWAGDSKVYHYRDGKPGFRTEDHSILSELVRTGHLSVSDAQAHREEQPVRGAIRGTENPTGLDYHYIDEIGPEDRFFLCSDGTLEFTSQEELDELFCGLYEGEDIVQVLEYRCSESSEDSYSGILVEIARVEESGAPVIAFTRNEAGEEEIAPSVLVGEAEEGKRSKIWFYVFGALIAFLFGATIFFMRETLFNLPTKGSLVQKAPDPADSAGMAARSLELPDPVRDGKALFREARDAENPALYAEAVSMMESGRPDGEAAYLIAIAYHEGRGELEKDPLKALEFAKISADSAWSSGQYLYGHLLIRKGGRENREKGIEYFRIAAKQGDPQAMRRLASMGLVWED